MSAFTTLPTIDGYDIIDEATGRAVGHTDTWAAAHGGANLLTGILNVSGPKALAKALSKGTYLLDDAAFYDARNAQEEVTKGSEAPLRDPHSFQRPRTGHRLT